MNLDQIIVMDNGVAVAIGKHEELLESCKIYQDIYNSQQKGSDDFDVMGGAL
jgi:ATP-binding cassette subfamily B protein